MECVKEIYLYVFSYAKKENPYQLLESDIVSKYIQTFARSDWAMKINSLMIIVLFAALHAHAQIDTLPIDTLNSGAVNSAKPVRVKRTGLVVSGACLFGTSYGLALILSPILASSPHTMDKKVSNVLWIPFAGPIAADVVDGMDEPAFTLVCAFWSIAEVTGAILLTAGLVGKKSSEQTTSSRLSFHPMLAQGKYPGFKMSLALP